MQHHPHLQSSTSSSSSGGEVTHSQQPIDLASRSAASVVHQVQLRQVRPTIFSSFSPQGEPPPLPKGQQTISTGPIISVNRSPHSANLTLLPARPAGGVTVSTSGGSTQLVGSSGLMTSAQNISYQIIRGPNVRPGGVVQQPASITVTPITPSNLGANIRLTGAVNNGTWIQTGGGAGTAFASPLRATTITVGGRAVRPEGKMIHIPQQGSVQHLAQLQMVDGKGSILKSPMSTPIVNIRGNLPGGASQGSSVIPLSPFTIRTASLTNISAIQQRPPTSISTGANQVHKVIPQHGGPPIQFVNANKNVLQTFTPIPKMNTVCLTLSTSASLAPNNSSPVVAVASRQGPSLLMTPSALTATGAVPQGTLPLTKVYRDGATLVDTIFATAPPNSSTSLGNTVTMSTVNVSAGQHQQMIATPTSVVVAGPAHSNPHVQSHSHHVVVHTTPTINLHAAAPPGGGLPPPPNLAPGGIAPTSYFVEKNLSFNLIQSHQPPQGPRPISLEKKMDGMGTKVLPAGSMIFTTTGHPHLQSLTGPGGGGNTTVTIPIAPAGTQHLNITHAVPYSQSGIHQGHIHQTTGTTQILTQVPGGGHYISSGAMISTGGMAGGGTPSITVTGPTHLTLGQTHPGLSVVTHQGHAIPAHVLSGSLALSQASAVTTGPSILTVTTTSVNTVSSSSTPGGNNILGSLINTSTSSSVIATSTTSSSTSSGVTTSNPPLTAPPPAQSPNHNQTQNQNSSKSTHSPRPSILRKREFTESHLTTRAQRNLSMSLNFAAAVNSSANSPFGTGLTSVSSASASAAANKENTGGLSIEKLGGLPLPLGSLSSVGGTSVISGISLLKKEFQPPTEESSWQSVSSNSSSGSSTISTTSETAELQMAQQQQQLQQQQQQQLLVPGTGPGLVDLTVSLPPCEPPPQPLKLAMTFPPVGVGGPVGKTSAQNGVVGIGSRTAGGPGAGPGRPRNSTAAKGINKDVERLKNKNKEDAVSPRKKPRKQQLTSSELLESASPEIYYNSKGKRFRKSELMDFSEGGVDRLEIDRIPEEPPPPRVVYYVKKPHMSLMQTNQIPPKPVSSHFQRYCDVKPKDDRRPTVSDLANTKNITHKVTGWRLQHMASQMSEVIDAENGVVSKFSTLLNRLEAKVGPNCPDRDLNRVVELLKGNIQRCKVIRDQMSESRSQALKILEHKPHIAEVISKYSSKRPTKKRDRL